MGRPGVRRLPRKAQIRDGCRIEPAFTGAKPVRSLPCKYVVQSDDVPVVMLKAAEVAAVYEGVLEAVSV